MSKNNKKENKNILNEAIVRRFMSLANLKPLASDFVKKLNEGCCQEEMEEETSEEMPEELPPSPEEEIPGSEEEEKGEGKEELVTKIMSAIASAIEEAIGVKIDVSGEEPSEEMPEELPPSPEEEIPGSEEEEELDEIGSTLKESDTEIIDETKDLVGKIKTKSPVEKDQKMKPGKLPKQLSERKMIVKIANRVASRLLAESKK